LEGWGPVVCVGHADSELVDDPSADVARLCELLSDIGVVVGDSPLMLIETIVPVDEVAAALLGLLDSPVDMTPETVVETADDAAGEDIDTMEDVDVPAPEFDGLIPDEDCGIIPPEDIEDELELQADDELPPM
jgi:hypothetical protein